MVLLGRDLLTSASHILPWLASGWGCRNRRATRPQEMLHKPHGPFRHPHRACRRDPIASEQARRAESLQPLRDGRLSFGIQWQPAQHRPLADTLRRGRTPDTAFRERAIVGAPPVRIPKPYSAVRLLFVGLPDRWQWWRGWLGASKPESGC